MNKEETKSQQKTELDLVYKIRENDHQQLRQQQVTTILNNNRNILMNQTNSQQGFNETQTVQLSSTLYKQSQQNSINKLISKNTIFLSKLKDRESILELIRIARNNQFSEEQKQELLEILFDKLSTKTSKQDPVQLHQLITLNFFLLDHLTKDIMHFYILLFIKMPNLLTITKVIETWLLKYEQAANFLEAVCTINIKEIQGTLVQFICNKDNLQNLKGRLEMLKLLIIYIGNEDLIAASFELKVTELMEQCSDQFFKEIYHIIIAYLKNEFFHQMKPIDKLVKKIAPKLSQQKNEQLSIAIKEYYQANSKSNQNQKNNNNMQQITQNEIL